MLSTGQPKRVDGESSLETQQWVIIGQYGHDGQRTRQTVEHENMPPGGDFPSNIITASYNAGYVAPHQSTSIPFLLSSSLAISISPINSLCASGTSLNVRTPNPSLNSKYDPNETRAQNGNFHCRLCQKCRSNGGVKVKEHTTGMISSWTILVEGIMWRKQAR